MHSTLQSRKWVGRADGKGGHANQLRVSARKAVRRSAQREEDRRLGADRVVHRHAQFLKVQQTLAAIREANQRALEESWKRPRYSYL